MRIVDVLTLELEHKSTFRCDCLFIYAGVISIVLIFFIITIHFDRIGCVNRLKRFLGVIRYCSLNAILYNINYPFFCIKFITQMLSCQSLK